MEGNIWNKSFTATVSKNIIKYDRNLYCIPTEIDENVIEVVVFYDVMVVEGSKKWELTLCGYFMGYKMTVNELRYNLRRMWGRYGFKDIVDYNNEPYKVPLWVKLCNVPLEAWTVKGISALASRLSKPLVMDSMTVEMCKQSNGKVRYARVLSEDTLEAMKRSANKFYVLEMYDVNEQNELNDLRNMEIVDEFLNKKLKQLAWKNGDTFENVKSLIISLKDIQRKINKDPHNHELRRKECEALNQYAEAMKDEGMILYQKAKVKWLSVGGRNNTYFHKTIKSILQRNRIDAISDDAGNRFEGLK
ncbi:zinc knuckle CX2CX4HX4C containing protein [Tanacetum coccineum]